MYAKVVKTPDANNNKCIYFYRPAGSSWEKGVCQSVCLSVCQTHKTEHWDKRKKDLSSSLHHTKGHLAYTF